MAQFRRNHSGTGRTSSYGLRLILVTAMLSALLLAWFTLGREGFPGDGKPSGAGYAGPDAWYFPAGGDCRQMAREGFTLCGKSAPERTVWVAFILMAGDPEPAGPDAWWEVGPFWKELQDHGHRWAEGAGRLYVVAGPWYAKTGSDRGAAEADGWFKVYLDLSEPDAKGIGFVVPRGASSPSVHRFAVSIDSVERLSGLDFFPELMTPQLESEIESSLDTDLWPTQPAVGMIE